MTPLSARDRLRVTEGMPRPAPRVRVGFTLIELLVVIGILAVLMGLIFPAISMVRENAKRGKTSAAINQVAAACQQYRQMRGLYPSGSVADQASWKIQVLAVERDGFPNGVVDGWGNALWYADTRNYDGFFANAAALDGKDVPMPDSFWVWSLGGNLKADPVAWTTPGGGPALTMPHGGEDDLANWKN
ncbi:MAG: hypothetical protein RLZZ127_555 [Planctomycetota bacterium]|jgi:prepilin-type N-terminal cleavage/methylation domain-containing protein